MDVDSEFEKLREFVIDEKDAEAESLVNNLEELTEFERGRYQGKFMAYDEVLGYIRQKLKYGFEE